MIQATELRIGNIVTLNGNHRLFSVIELKRYFAYLKTGNSCWVDYGYSELRGVPITAEVLEQCGFKENDRGIWIDGQDRQMWILRLKDFNSVGWESYEQCVSFPEDVKHLHQLQNLFYAITGKELTYDPT